ncbi:MAG TPA: selenium-dependent molybdenum cofactor biosynthesis protein YqeB [Bacillota bacterium]|nr:selenium-dependent molybdenum cofactor biosynthesis protein YqeB [Bacillota bacterium]
MVVIKGAGDLATGTAHRLWQAGFDVVMLELPRPLVVRRAASFATAVYDGSIQVEGVTAVKCAGMDQLEDLLARRIVPVLVDPGARIIKRLRPGVLVDGIMAKRNTGTAITDAPLVIGLGPGFTAGGDVHAVIETNRGPNLGRVIYHGTAEPDTAVPGEVGGFAAERLLRAPADGIFRPLYKIGDQVEQGEVVAYVGEVPVKAAISGLLRGLLYPGLTVTAGLKVGDIDPRGAAIDPQAISDKARAVGGGVLEAIMHRYFNR